MAHLDCYFHYAPPLYNGRIGYALFSYFWRGMQDDAGCTDLPPREYGRAGSEPTGCDRESEGRLLRRRHLPREGVRRSRAIGPSCRGA